MDKYPKVHVLLDGYCIQAKENDCSEASGTVTLILTEGKKILVDCGDPWNGACVIQALSKYSLNCDDITDLIITHGHSDHCGNLSLFKQAKIYMGDDVAKGGIYEIYTGIWRLDNSVQVKPTPGHTDHDRSIIVTGTEYGTVAIVGDIFEEENDDDSWKANSKYPEEQKKSREIILSEADWIVPGHGTNYRDEIY
ncbi:metallo-beta-lactamase superfamily protein [Loa loa]|uniref:Metallo-beta-lactamase superfamily protein n=1 Tax=Loa loa TaxID=7209 RepID=A0A1I7V7X3_LOALO|nr:metallo-beta-lactamase superfamily protein [Loa loa]EFO15590.2 metallo-beta-lactamase superfamily protein [Loa loa]